MGIRWSKIRERIEALLCAELEGKVRFYLTSYNQTETPTGRGWIEKDGEEIFAFSSHDGKRQQFYEAIVGYPEFAIEDALTSEDEIVRGIALIDRRVGKRRIEKIDISADESSFVRFMYQLRLDTMKSS